MAGFTCGCADTGLRRLFYVASWRWKKWAFAEVERGPGCRRGHSRYRNRVTTSCAVLNIAAALFIESQRASEVTLSLRNVTEALALDIAHL